VHVGQRRGALREKEAAVGSDGRKRPGRAGSRGRRRRNLLAADPHCWYCGIRLTAFTEAVTPEGGAPEDSATVEHLFSRVRYRQRPLPGIRVLACLACNRDRNTWSLALAAERARERWNEKQKMLLRGK
jgi:hypothetical protein